MVDNLDVGQDPAQVHDQEVADEVEYLREVKATMRGFFRWRHGEDDDLDEDPSPPVDQDALDLQRGREELAKLVDHARSQGHVLDPDAIDDDDLARLGASARQRDFEELLESLPRRLEQAVARPRKMHPIEAMRLALVRRHNMIVVDGQLDTQTGRWIAGNPRYTGLLLDQKLGMGEPILHLDPEPDKRHTTDIAWSRVTPWPGRGTLTPHLETDKRRKARPTMYP